MASSFYFQAFEDRTPPEPLVHVPGRELIFQVLAIVSLSCGAWYLVWRWSSSLNSHALWFALPLVIAETVAFIGMGLFVFNLWRVDDYQEQPAPRSYSETVAADPGQHRSISVDVFIATFNEDPELVRISIRDAKALRYPHPIDIVVHVLDDGGRVEMRRVAEEEAVIYLTRSSNEGFKAGNLRNALDQTSGDFLVICDADTRLFPTMLEHTLGYFRDPDVAWVQTPQWFYDLPEGRRLPDALGRRLGSVGQFVGTITERIIGRVQIGADPFCNDARFFYDVLQRRRNWANASFCCGAASVHRREAALRGALRRYADAVDADVRKATKGMSASAVTSVRADAVARDIALDTEMTPFTFHVSEDIYTSILLHSDPTRRWKSVMHPRVESKMLSPQDLQTWMIQRFKYAGGTFDIAVHDNPIFRRGLSLPQRLMYAATIWSYFGCLWNIVFLVSPIIYLFTGIAPVSTYSFEFFKHALPFLFFNELAMIVGLWGIVPTTGRAMYLAFFPVALRAFWMVLKGERVKFPTTPKERQDGRFLHLVKPQLALIGLSITAVIWGALHTSSQSGHTGGLIANAAWLGIGVVALLTIVRAAVWRPEMATAHAVEGRP